MSQTSVTLFDDLVLQILDLVPLKSRRRFKSVSKHWLSLISHNSKPSLALLLQAATPEGDFLPRVDLITATATEEPSVITKYTVLRVELGSQSLITCLRSSNGLLLLARTGPKSSKRPNNIHTRYHVYDPVTRQHDTLPAPCPADYEHVTASLAHDPARSAHYKVVCLYKVRTRPVITQKIMVYSSETRRWRRWDDSSSCLDRVGDCYYDRWGNGCYWNGSVYYVPDKLGRKVFGFETKTEKLVQIMLPSGERRGHKRIVVSSGSLHLLTSPDYEGTEVRVYEMEKDGSTLRLKYKLDHFGDDVSAKLSPYAKEMVSTHYKTRLFYRYHLYFPMPEANNCDDGDDDDEEELWLIQEVPKLMMLYKIRSRTADIVKLGCEEFEIHDQRTWRHHDRIVSVLEIPIAG